MKTGDLDGDGNIDLSLVNSRLGDLTTLWGHGDGTFDTPDRIDAGLRPTSLQATDLNGDDRTDLVSLDNERGQVVSLINKAAMSSQCTLRELAPLSMMPITIVICSS